MATTVTVLLDESAVSTYYFTKASVGQDWRRRMARCIGSALRAADKDRVILRIDFAALERPSAAVPGEPEVELGRIKWPNGFRLKPAVARL
jgi:hypothetical protein